MSIGKRGKMKEKRFKKTVIECNLNLKWPSVLRRPETLIHDTRMMRRGKGTRGGRKEGREDERKGIMEKRKNEDINGVRE